MEFKVGDRIIVIGNAVLKKYYNIPTGTRGEIIKVIKDGLGEPSTLITSYQVRIGRDKIFIFFGDEIELDKQYYREKRLNRILE